MNSDTVTAIAATAIALGSLWISYSQTKATRLHNRQSVRPLLQIQPFSEAEHSWFWDLVTRRLLIEITYESLYGGENFTAMPPPP
ncbi:hypothetical protein ACFWFF_22640 [Streptomyces sp. NPDC060223]|uniref:hypothetical protein n=1 Tax=unclassified Streptomyces TaxID=2593676 RepID=UPI00362BBC3A